MTTASKDKPSNQPNLSKNQIRYLRGLAHAIHPVISVGQHGLTDGVLTELMNALAQHELLKIKIANDDRDERAQITEALLTHSGAQKIQSIGKTLVVFWRNHEAPKLDLPRK